ncbi:hypothetical protein ACFL9S_03480 [Erwinia sp. AnSW2-5]|uniref:hypothetical protein n=1 Tax=Erwinia sp. AnSW2-5 TaxID=3367692 RepID=UPI00385C5DCF
MSYYVSGCKDNGSETVTCDDSEAQFWTLYVRDDAGLSQGIIDLAFREDAEAAMAVYVERDALNETLSRYSMSPAWADQRQNESKYVREVLGFGADADDVSPKDLVDAIAALQEQVRALAAENVALKSVFNTEEISEEAVEAFTETAIMDHDWDDTGSWSWVDNDSDVIRAVLAAIKPETPATDAAIREIVETSRAEGIHFAANRILAAWESGFINDTPAMAYDISGAVLSAIEFLPNADEAEFKRDYADEVRARIRAGEVL